MTDTFEAIIKQKQAAIDKVVAELEELKNFRNPPPDSELRKCHMSELVFLIALDAQLEALHMHAENIQETAHKAADGAQLTAQVLQELGKSSDAKGGASFGW